MSEEKNLDIEACFRPVVEKHGRELFALVMNAGLGRQAAEVLSTMAQKHHSQHGLRAAGMLADCFNQVSNAYCAKMEWTQEQLAECDRDIQMAFRTKLIVPETGSIVLQ